MIGVPNLVKLFPRARPRLPIREAPNPIRKDPRKVTGRCLLPARAGLNVYATAKLTPVRSRQADSTRSAGGGQTPYLGDARTLLRSPAGRGVAVRGIRHGLIERYCVVQYAYVTQYHIRRAPFDP